MNVRSFLSVWFTFAAFPAAACQVSSNLVLNCGFDTDLAHWSIAAGSCAHDDAAGVSKIGSARCESAALAPGAHQMKIRQCASGAAAGQYALGVYARRDSGSGVECVVDVEAHADADCNGTARIDSAKVIPQPNAFARSAPKDLALPANAAAVSIEVVCYSSNSFSVLLDDVLLGADLIFANGFDFARPVLTAGATLEYTENQAASVIDSTISVSDTDSANLASATVSITGNFQSGEDLLACTGCGPIVPVYTPGTGILTLTGSATLSQYQSALRDVTYENTSENPSPATRTITWLANDGSISSLAVTSNVTVAAENDLPEVTAGASLTYTENDAATVIDATVTVADPDDNNIESATVSITGNFQSGEDSLACGTCGSIVPVYTPGTGVLTLTGTATIAQYQAALRTVTYRNSSDNPSTLSRRIGWVANDGIDSSLEAVSTVNITAVNDTPVGAVPPGSPFAITGNVRRSIAAGTLLVGATDAENGTLTTQLSGVPTNNANVVVNADGSFTYNPGAGYEGSASFQFVVCDAAPLCSTPLTVGVAISGMIWFISPTGSDVNSGRLSDPLNTITAFAALNNGTGNNPAPNDNIFLHNGSYTGTLTLLAGQRLFGEGMSITLAAASGITPPAGSDALPTTTLANRPAWTSSGTTLTLGTGNTIRGFNIGNSTTAKISGTGFGTLTVNEIALSGSGKALNFATGAFSGSSAFDSIASTGSGTQGISFAGITGGTLTIGGTSISGAATQGILVGTTQANVNFGNTTVNAATDGVSLQNNSAGTRTFGTLSITNGSGAGFLHAVGGGTTTAGTTTITNPGGAGINIVNSTTAVSFGNTNITQSGGPGVDLSTNSGAVTFADLDIASDAGQRALLAVNNTGTITSTSGTIVASNAGGAFAISGLSAASRTPLALVFDSISVTNDSVVGINIALVSGNLTVGTTTIAGGGFVGVQVLTTAAGGTMNFGNTNVTAANSVAGVRLGIAGQGNAGNISFADLDIAPASGHPGLIGIENTGTITATSGTINATSASAVQITGVSTATRTPLAMVLDSVTSNGGVNNIALTNVSGSLAMNAGALSGASAAAVAMTGSTATVTYSGSVANTTGGVSLTSNTGGTMTFRGGINLSTGANTAFSATGGGTVNVCDENPCAPGATGGLLNTLTTTTGIALNVANTTIGANNLEFRSINHNGNNTAIALNTTGAGELKVLGTGTTAGTGGTIENIVGADAITLNTTGGRITLKNMIIEDISASGDASNAIDTRSGVDAIQGVMVNGGLTLDGTTIRRISDNAILGGTNGPPDLATVWDGLTITNSTIEDSNRFHVAARGDANNEGMVRILGIRGAVNVSGSTFQRGGEHFDFFVTGGTLTMLATTNTFNFAYKEFTSGTLASVGGHCLDVTVQGASNASVTIGDRVNDALDNNFLNCRLGSVRVGSDAAATGNIDVIVGRNDFTVNDHSSGIGGDFDFPMGGVLIFSLGTDTATVDAVIDGNYFDEVTNASGGVGQLTLAMTNGTWQALVEDNTFDTPGNAPWFLRADSTVGGRVLFRNNLVIKGAFCSTDPASAGGGCDLGAGQLCPGAAGFCGPGIRTLADLQNSAVLDLTINNDQFAEHDAGFDPGQTFEARILNTGGGGTLCLDLTNNRAPDGYSIEEFAGDFNLMGSGSCPVGSPSPNCQTLLGNRGNRGGANVATTNPPFVNVEIGASIDVLNATCLQPSGTPPF